MIGTAEASTLSAPECLVLLSLPEYDGRQAVKLGLLTLMAQGRIFTEETEEHRFFSHRKVTHLRISANPNLAKPPQSEVLSPLFRLVGQTQAAGGSVADTMARFDREFGGTDGFVETVVCPALIRRDLAEAHTHRGFFSTRTQVVRTSNGETERARIEAAMTRARFIPQYIRSDPARLVAALTAVGAAILLIEELRPYYDQISTAMQQQGGAALTPGVDLGDFNFGDLDFADFDRFDAGFDAAGGDGGSDGGSDGGGDSSC